MAVSIDDEITELCASLQNTVLKIYNEVKT